MAQTRIPKTWGHEIILHNEEYCAKLLVYDGIRTSSKHYHEKKHETFVVLRGYFDIEWYALDDPEAKGAQKFGPGACLVLEPRTVHRVSCLSPQGGMLVEASTHDDPDDCVRLEASANPFG
jgi:mannose-6-phosphate isomerase-like protein (cupin superfamily)